MSKNIKYIIIPIVLSNFIFIGQSVLLAQPVLAAGTVCGDSGQGKCQDVCGPGDEVISPTVSSAGYSRCEDGKSCCVSTKCSNNSIGFGECFPPNKDGSEHSCDLNVPGIWTSDCLSPNICCTVPKEQSNMNIGPTTPTPGQENVPGQGNENIFPPGKEGASAPHQTTPLVPCNGLNCTLCDVFKLIKNLINLFIELTFALAGGFIVWGAIEIMTAGGDETKVKAGREKVTTAIYGIVIVLIAWLFIGTVLQILTGSSSVLPWNKIQC